MKVNTQNREMPSFLLHLPSFGSQNAEARAILSRKRLVDSRENATKTDIQ